MDTRKGPSKSHVPPIAPHACHVCYFLVVITDGSHQFVTEMISTTALHLYVLRAEPYQVTKQVALYSPPVG